MIISHQKPDGDTIGANLALLHYLEEKGKKYESYCLSPLPREFSFLPLSHKIKNQTDIFKQKFDLVIVLDSGDLRYAGVEEEIKKLLPDFLLINIDHHPTNKYFGQINIVDERAASTTEVLYGLFSAIGYLPGRQIATCLLTGICTDTDNFSNPATSHSVLKISAELLERGANFQVILKNILRGQPVPVLKLWGKVLSRLQLNSRGIAVTVVTAEDLVEENLTEEAVFGISNFLNNLYGVEAVLVLREEMAGFVRGSLRTSSENLDVSRLAKFLGGGGHKKAAGFSIPGRLLCDKSGCWTVV